MKRGGRWLIVIAVFAVVAFLFLAGPNGLIRFIRMKRREAELERRMVQLEAEIEITRQKIQRLASDPEFLREVAKERLEMIDPQDTLKKDTTQTDNPVNDSLPRGG